MFRVAPWPESFCCLLLDYDDTVVEARSHRTKMLTRTLTGLGRSVEHSGFDGAYDLSFRELVRRIDPNGEFEPFFWEYLKAVELSPAALLPGVSELISRMRGQGERIGLISSSDSRLIVAELRGLGVADLFELIIGSNHAGPRKPDKGVLLAAASSLLDEKKLSPSDVIYVGDSLADQLMSQQAGVRFIGVATGLVSKEEFVAAGLSDEAVLDNLQELIPRLEFV